MVVGMRVAENVGLGVGVRLPGEGVATALRETVSVREWLRVWRPEAEAVVVLECVAVGMSEGVWVCVGLREAVME